MVVAGEEVTIGWFVVAFLITGFSLTVLQTVAIRELLVSFSGNELSVSLILAAWLLLQALGSGLAGRVVGRLPPRPGFYTLLQAGLALFLFPSFLLALNVRGLVGAVPGEAVAFGPAGGAALLVLTPVGLLGGAAFVVASRVSGSAGRVYALEAAGSIAGGIAFTYILLPLLTSTQVVLLLVALNALSAALLAGASPRRRFLPAAVGGLFALVALVVSLSPLGPALHRRLVAGRWAPYPLAYEGNSPVGNVAVLAAEGQVSAFANGALVLTAPHPDIAAVEQIVHLPALFLDAPPRRVLVIGGGAGGVLHEVERYPLEQVDYAEPDPLLIHAVRSVPTVLTAAELSDRRLNLATEDGRRFVQHAAGPYDLVLLNLPPPTTLVLNRLYTREFLEQVRGLLTPRGVLALPAPPARTYLSSPAAGLLASYERTLRAVFPHLRAIPADEQTLWLASPQNPLDLEAGELARRWAARGLEGRMLRADYLRYLLDEAVARELAARLAAGPGAVVNSDAVPAGLRYALGYESARLSPGLLPFFEQLGQVQWWHGAAGIALLTIVALLLVRRPAVSGAVAVVTTGLVGMTTSVLVLLSFQVIYGSMYRQLGLLTTAFMAGVSAGGWLMTAHVGRLRHPWGTLLLLEGGGVLAAAGLAGMLALLLRHADPFSALPHALLLAANAGAGLLVGMEFPLANALRGGEAGRGAAVLYAADLIGATAGAVLVAALSLPVLGLVGTALLAAMAKGGSLLVVLRGRRGSAAR